VFGPRHLPIPPVEPEPNLSLPAKKIMRRVLGGPAGATGMTWQEVLPLMEKYVKKHGWTSQNTIAEAIGCSPHTVRKAKENSCVVIEALGDAMLTKTPSPKRLTEPAAERHAESRHKGIKIDDSVDPYKAADLLSDEDEDFDDEE